MKDFYTPSLLRKQRCKFIKPGRVGLAMLLLIWVVDVNAQKKVAITIDDVPNTQLYAKENYRPLLLEKLEKQSIPATIFINEGLIGRTDSIQKNLSLLDQWLSKPFITAGNHTYGHSRYSAVGLDSFRVEVEQGGELTQTLLSKYQKTYRYFRFPYNDLGEDSIAHIQIRSFLDSVGLQIAPFTVESEDWVFNAVYESYLELGDSIKAAEIGMLYVEKTMAYVNFFEELSTELYGRNIHQIYLCHDNKLNADYLDRIVEALSNDGYQFIDLEEALSDEVYNTADNYYKKWGISWIYRWMKLQKTRVGYMRKEPSNQKVLKLFEEIK